MSDRIRRRKWADRALEKLRSKLDRDEKFFLANAFCGSGKTWVFLDLCVELYRRGLIDMILAFSPRITLCRQYEKKWNEIRELYDEPTFGQVIYRKNQRPLVAGCLFGGPQQGVAATYPGLVSQPVIYEDLCKEFKVALIGDEAQILGSSREPEEAMATKAAEYFARLSQLSRFTMLGTGTPYRSDGELLWGCEHMYGEPDSKGYRTLNADVDATYFEGIEEGYLRPVEFELHNADAIKEYLDNGQREELVLRNMDSGVREILIRPDVWEPMVDKAMIKLREVRELDKRYSLLIGACSISHAKAIQKYIVSRYTEFASLIAVSSDSDANDNLETFRNGAYHALVSVGMVYVGYDHSWITVVLCLGSFRWPGWLDQFVFRGGRIVSERPLEEQTLWVIGPNDKLFSKWADMRRRDALKGLNARRVSTGGDPPPKPRLSVILEAEVTGSISKGMDPTYDIDDPHRSMQIDQLIKQWDLGATKKTGLEKLFRETGIDPSAYIMKTGPSHHPRGNPDICDEDYKALIRTKLREITNEIDATAKKHWPSIEHGWAYERINDQFRKGNPKFRIGDNGLGTDILRDALDWAKNVLLPQVLSWKSKTSV